MPNPAGGTGTVPANNRALYVFYSNEFISIEFHERGKAHLTFNLPDNLLIRGDNIPYFR